MANNHISNYKNPDGLKIRQALPGQFLIPLVTAMTFLAALMIAGSYASQVLAQRWNNGAASTVILQIPNPGTPVPQSISPVPMPSSHTAQINAIISLLSTSKELSAFHKLSDQEINTLLSPWFHKDIQSFALSIPAIIELHLKNSTLSDQLKTDLKNLAPDIVIEQSNFWSQRLNMLANSLQTCAFIALIIVISIAGIVIALATRTGLIHCKQTIEILHNLGASDHYICSRFSKRSATLAFTGGAIGSLCALPLLIFMTYLSLPFSNNPNWEMLANQSWINSLSSFPMTLLLIILSLPFWNYFIGGLATTLIVYFWLRRLT